MAGNIYSNKDFTGHDLSDRHDMNNLTISNSCFSQETPNRKIFPANLLGVTFVDCNLDNVLVPPGNLLVNCSKKVFKVQNDLEDWHVDPNTLAPLKPLDEDRFDRLGISKKPVDIPAEKTIKPITAIKMDLLLKLRDTDIKQANHEINQNYPGLGDLEE